MKAIWNGKTIAESTETIIIEGNHYFPIEAVNRAFLHENNHITRCAWKGIANYYDIVVDNNKNESAAWYYPKPLKAAENIKGRIAFWKGVEIVD